MATTVYTAVQLAAAVAAGSEYDYVYLGADIQIPVFGITIGSNKTSLVIDGFSEGVYHTLEDANSIFETDTIGIRAASNITLTFKNMTITGRNYFGTPNISELADTGGVTVIYENVTYTGPQITYNPNGLTRYIDCDITISYPQATGRVQEVGEVNRVEFKGVNTITHTGTGDAVFWFRGAVGTAYLKVLQDSEVTISTSNYFMFSKTPVIPTTQNPVAYELESGASLTIASHHGISLNSEHRAASFLVGENASFRYIQETDNDNAASLYLNGELTVSPGASVYMQADFDASRPLVSFIEGSGQISVDNPKSFVLYSRSSSVAEVGGGGVTRPFVITGGQLNQWYEASPLPGAGDINDGPDRKWNKPNWSQFTMQGSVTALSTVVDSTTFTPEELEDLPDPGDLSFQDARVISIGNLPLTVELVTDDSYTISGYTDPGAQVYVTYTVDGDDYSLEQTAGAGGTFLFIIQAPIPAGTVVTVKSNVPFLITEVKKTSEPASDQIIIQRSPERIEFRLPPVTTEPYALLGRINPSDAVEVLDSRSVCTRWELLASIAGPLTASSGEVLENALIFKDNNDGIHVLSATPTVVYDSGPDPIPQQTNIFWPANRGVLVRATEPIRSGVEYSAELNWEIRLAT